MQQITQITTDPLQKHTIVLDDGTTFVMTLYFASMQYGWFIQSITYDLLNFTLNNIRVCNNPNMLHPWKNILPFGLACFSTADREPSQLQDFSSGNSILYVLSAAEVAQYTEFLNGQT